MEKWGLSRYTALIRDDSGDLILHNSYMGAIAYIPADQTANIEKFIFQGITEDDLDDKALKELCDGGFFISSSLDEQKLVSELLYKERELMEFNIIIMPHENCNFRCTYCYESHNRGKMNQDTISGLKILVDHKAKEYQRINISWFGGEPLLAKDVIYELSKSFINSCEKNKILYKSDMTTNGYFLTPRVVDSLLNHEIKSFQVTLDGPETTHDNTRKLANGGKTYKRILGNLINMHNSDAEFHVTIRVNFNYDSIPLMDQFFFEISNYFANDPRFSLYFRPIGKWGGKNDANLETCDEKYSTSVKAGLTERHIKFGFSDKTIKGFLGSHGNVCYAAKNSSIVVGCDGTIYKCTLGFDDPRNQVGKLTRDGQMLIDQSKWDLWVKIDDKDISGCIQCPFIPSCQSRHCPRSAMELKRVVCPMTKAEYESMVRAVVLSNNPVNSDSLAVSS
ncbi:MAG: uncharacterized protein QG641_1804 [Candidatus Poribacteria bacterium]|nr:uncharacterized protein [Candidatus Poribacteria bacterium]